MKKRPITREHLKIARHHANHLWQKIGFAGVGITCGIIVVLQMLLPWNNLTLYATIDGESVGGQSMTDVEKKLNDKYKKLPIALYFGNSPKAYRQPFPEDLGLTVNSKPQVEAKAYSWWLRLIPTSALWAHWVVPTTTPAYQRSNDKVASYVEKELGQSCRVTAQNASLVYKDKKLSVVPAIDGGTCKLEDVQKLLENVSPRVNDHQLRIAMKEHPARIHDAEAKTYGNQLTSRAKDLAIHAGSSDVKVPTETFLSWLDFAAPDSGNTATVNADRSTEFFDKELSPKVSVKAGTNKISTVDFTEVSRVNGAPGQTLDNQATIQALNEWIGGAEAKPVAKVKAVAPSNNYTRTYTATDTGMSALIEQFAKDKGGSWGVSYMSLSGNARNASYQGDKSFRTASTYKLFVAYGALKRVESGQWSWSMQVNGGRDLAKCLDDMIVKSDNPCGETLLDKIGFKTLTSELKAIGLNNSSFTCACGFPVTTANDLVRFNGALQAGQLLNADSTSRLIGLMKRNVYRQGIPKGASGQTADKVGFLDAFLHDAAIVYSPSGTYALTIMTEGSSWANMAELTRKIETLRAQG
jgi:beta-lactamase class A